MYERINLFMSIRKHTLNFLLAFLYQIAVLQRQQKRLHTNCKTSYGAFSYLREFDLVSIFYDVFSFSEEVGNTEKIFIVKRILV